MFSLLFPIIYLFCSTFWQIFFAFSLDILIEFWIYLMKSLVARGFFVFPEHSFKVEFCFFLNLVFLSSFLRILISFSFLSFKIYFCSLYCLSSVPLLLFVCLVSLCLGFCSTSDDTCELCVWCGRGLSSNSFPKIWVGWYPYIFLPVPQSCLLGRWVSPVRSTPVPVNRE